MDDFDIDNIDRLKWLLLVAGCSAVFIYGFAQKSRVSWFLDRFQAPLELTYILFSDVERGLSYSMSGSAVMLNTVTP